MLLTNNTWDCKYDLINITQEELLDLNDLIENAPLPMKRNFYRIKRDIEHFLGENKLPKKK